MNDETLPRRAMRAEMLDAETEKRLALAWRDNRDEQALHRLVSAYMRLAISMASKYRRYGASMNDLIQEASLGLMKAAEKFDPDRDVRFSTYAMWWIKASIQDYVMRNWSMVRTGSTSGQKSLFFNLKRVKAKLERDLSARGVELDGHQLRALIAIEVGVTQAEVELMEGRLAGSDFSLNAQQSGEEEGREWIETIEDPSDRAEDVIGQQKDLGALRVWLAEAMRKLSPREQLILRERRLVEKGRTLESLGEELRLSKERVRQVEAAAFAKLRTYLEARSPEIRDLIS